MHLINCKNKNNQATVIDIDTEKNRQDNFCSLSDTDFRTDEPVKNFFNGEKKEEVIVDGAEVVTEYNPELEEALNKELEDLKEEYKVVYGKEVPVNKKNDRERIHTKIMDITNPETLTPVE